MNAPASPPSSLHGDGVPHIKGSSLTRDTHRAGVQMVQNWCTKADRHAVSSQRGTFPDVGGARRDAQARGHFAVGAIGFQVLDAVNPETDFETSLVGCCGLKCVQHSR
jgi:hypothetical protein